MIPDTYIPVGHTSLVKRGKTPLQVQTEYASRPYPRLTTTVLDSGQVVHKVERRLEHAVESTEEQVHTEAAMKQQHSEILSLIQGSSADHSGLSGHRVPERATGSTYERLTCVPGFQHVYYLDAGGSFTSKNASQQFKKAFGSVFKTLAQMIDVFPLLPGGFGEREKGVYEVKRDSLYFVSAGVECYFIEVCPTGERVDYETVLKHFLIDSI